MASVRSYDETGRLHVAFAVITRGIVSEYSGKQVFNWEGLGLDPERTYRIYRDPEELACGASSFVGKPIFCWHVPLDMPPPLDMAVGEVGGPAEMWFTTLIAPLTIWAPEAIEVVESGWKRCLSVGFRYDYVAEPGVALDGSRYDAVMQNISCHHVALCMQGRVPGALVPP